MIPAVIRIRPIELTTACRRAFCDGVKKRVVFSGVQPTGHLHVGNYFGAVEKWIQMQNDAQVGRMYISVVDLHTLTIPDANERIKNSLRDRVYWMAASLLACGLDPKKCIFFRQSALPQHCELTWILGCLGTVAQLKHIAQYKDRSRNYKYGNVPLGLLLYPVLQAADILLYRATHVPVGDDQVQHLDIAKHLATSFNAYYKSNLFPVPQRVVSDFGRVKSLRDPTKKMSKSDYDQRGCLMLTDTPEILREKIKKALTDSISKVTYEPESRPGVANLLNIHSVCSGKSPTTISDEVSSLSTADYKMVVADCVIEKFRPFRDEYRRLMNDKAHLDSVLKSGEESASKYADETMRLVKDVVGLAN